MAADLLLPLLFCGILCWGAVQGVDVFAAFRTGAARGLTAAGEILPSLIALVTAVAMLRASGALELLCTAFAPAARAAARISGVRLTTVTSAAGRIFAAASRAARPWA